MLARVAGGLISRAAWRCKTQLVPWWRMTASKYLKILLYNMEDKNLQTSLHKLKVLYKSDNYIIVNKDFDVIINCEDPERLSVCRQMAHKFPDLVVPTLQHSFYVVHRLDYSTSGALLFALNRRAAATASKVFEARRTRKFYLAVVHGRLGPDKLQIDLPIGDDARPEMEKLRMCTPNQDYCVKPRPANTRCVVLARGTFNSKPATKVMLYPSTGRRHQLRVHMQEVGHTIVGDYTYSNRTDIYPYRMFLHAFRLVVPNSLESIDIQTEDPFNEDNPMNKWHVTETVFDIGKAFDIFSEDDCNIEWTKME